MTYGYRGDFGDYGDEPEDLGLGCEYGCSEFCDDPGTREIGLCTTDCRTYMKSLEGKWEEESGWLLAIRTEGKCGSCGGSLAKGFINGVMLDKYATWAFPSWGNILARDEDKRQFKRATSFVCDDCINLRKLGRGPPIKWAVEIYQEDEGYKVRLHDIDGLEAAQPITEEDLHSPEGRQASE